MWILQRKRGWLFFAMLISAMIISADSKRFHSIAGPFTVNLKRLEPCPKGMNGRETFTFQARDARTRRRQVLTYTGNITTSMNFDDNLGGIMRISSWSNMGGWKDNAYYFKMPGCCKALATIIPQLWNNYVYSVLNEPSTCPYLPGIFRFVNVSWNLDEFGVKHFFYGRWRVDVQLYEIKTDDILACARVYADTVPL